MAAKIIAIFLALQSFFTCFFNKIDVFNRYSFYVDTAQLSEEIGNKVSNVNVWDMGTSFYSPVRNTNSDITEFTEYVQFMQCSGGGFTRDLFKNPYDLSVLDDYDFSRLIKNCEGVISLGMKPMLKLGNVPMKYTANAAAAGMSDNVRPPDDYNQYYCYMAALAKSLVDYFGKDEVSTWRFGVLTEFENKDWFAADNNSPLTTKEAYFKLYDYTVAALQNEIGQDVYVGAHAMAVTEGLWDETEFLRHCACGKNYYTGKIGTRICYLACSFYDTKPGEFTAGKTIPEMFAELKRAAAVYGLNDLNYGIDEGRILYGNNYGQSDNQLVSRTVGYSWQAAYDARIFGQLIDSDIDYFSAWSYLSGGLFNGVPNITYHAAKQMYAMANAKRATVTDNSKGRTLTGEVKTYAGYNEDISAVQAFVYNFKNDLNYKRKADVSIDFNVPQLANGDAKVTIYRLDDNCNFFDEWCIDRISYGITDDMFSWSPDDGNVSMLNNANATELFNNTLYNKYIECARLVPEEYDAKIKDSKLHIDLDVAANTAVFIEITK